MALIPSDEHGSFIARTQAEDASQDALANDIQYLKQRWNEILAASKSATPGTVLYRELNLAQRVLRDWVGDRTTRVLVDDPYRIDGLRSFANSTCPVSCLALRTSLASDPCSNYTTSSKRSRRP